jgi:hypothetical protein
VAAQDRRRQVGEGLAGAGAGLREKDAPAAEDAGDGSRHVALTGAGLELRHRPRERAVVGEDAIDETV